jgi:hypothetical protein
MCLGLRFAVGFMAALVVIKHESLIRQLFHIRQSAEYIDQFTELVNQLVAYENSSDHKYYTTRFVDDIKSVVLLQHPADLDTACVLALLQEEAATMRRKEPSKPETVFRPRHQNTATPLPLPLPPSGDKILGGKIADVKKNTDTNRSSQVDNKVSALRAYRRAKCLCQYCAKKYFRGHKCAPTIQLQVVQELWDMLQDGVEDTKITDTSD